MNSNPEYIIASREGLYIANKHGARKVANGHYFGVTIREKTIFCFQYSRWHAEKSPDPTGSLVRFFYEDGALRGPDLLYHPLDHDCHQIDFFDGAMFVVDTLNQRVLEFDRHWRLVTAHQILPNEGWDGPRYAHINSFYGRDDRIYLMMHNYRKNVPSQIIEYDRNFRELSAVTLRSKGCHDIVRMENGAFVYCDSQSGSIASTDGVIVKVDQFLTRGLSVGPDEIAVGSSHFGQRIERALLPGFLTFFDRTFQRTGRIYLPAAPTQIRRLDGQDLSLSFPRTV